MVCARARERRIAPLWNGPKILRVLLSMMKVSSPFFAALNRIVYPVVSLVELEVVLFVTFEVFYERVAH